MPPTRIPSSTKEPKMKTSSRIVCLVLAALPASLRAADYVTTVTNTPNLLGYWRFTPSTQANSSVNGYTGTFFGDAAVGAAGSGPALAVDPTNRRLTLDGTGDYVSTSLTGQISTQGSILGWYNFSALPSVTGRIFTIATESAVGDDFSLLITTDNRIRFYTDSGGNSASTNPVTDLNAWHFVAGTFSNTGTRSLYLDGVDVTSGSATSSHTLNNATFTIGEDTVFSGRTFQGGLDEIAVYNRQLSATEVSNIFASAGTVPEPGAISLILLGAIGFSASRTRRRSHAAQGSTSSATSA